MDYIKYYAGFVISLVGLAGLLAGGNWVWAGAATFLAVTALDVLLPRDMARRQMPSDTLAIIPVYIGALAPVAIFIALAWRIGTNTLTLTQLIGATLSCGWLAMVPGIAAQHELFHSRNRLARTVGRYSQFTLFDGLRDVEHIACHHIQVATADDISTAARGTSLYAYTPRAFLHTIRASLQAESAALKRRQRSAWHIGHRAWRALGIQVAFQTITYLLGGWVAVLCSLAAMLMARLWTESFSYFQHYGLVRIPNTPIGRRHSWVHMGAITRLVGFELTNHCDHHLVAYLPFYKLQPHREAIELPSIFVCFLAALVPPVWERYIIKPALKRWDLEFATAQELAIARAQNRAANWEDWTAARSTSAVEPLTVGC